MTAARLRARWLTGIATGVLLVSGPVLPAAASNPAGVGAPSTATTTAPSCEVTDGIEPTLVDFELSPEVVDARAGKVVVDFKAKVSDSETGVHYVVVSLKPTKTLTPGRPSVNMEAVRTSGSVTSGTWTASHTFHKWSLDGEWLVSVGVFDRAGNSTDLHSTELIAGGWPGTLTVRSHPDTSNPLMEDLTASARAVNTRDNSQRVVFVADVRDRGESGVSQVQGDLITLRVRTVDFHHVPGTSKFRGALTVPRFAAPVAVDTWPLVMSLYDRAGNSHRYLSGELRERNMPSRLTVTTHPDTTPPTISQLDLADASVDVTLSDANVPVTAVASDAQSGILNIVASLSSGVTHSVGGQLGLDAGGTPQAGPWVGEIWVGQCQYSGVYTVSDITVRDRTGNELVLDADDIAAAGLDEELTIIGR